MKLFFSVFCAMLLNFSFAQFDSTKILNEINSLTNDSLVDDFWRRLDSCDQDLNTLKNPVQQTENLIKAICFFKKFGFSDYNRFDSTKISYSDAEMHSLVIWMHSSYVDLNYYTFPLVYECSKIYKGFDYPYYFLQNLMLLSSETSSTESIQKLKEMEVKSFVDLNYKKLFELANEYQLLKKEKLNSQDILGYWKIEGFEAKIYKTKNNKYYLEHLGNTVKLKKNICAKYSYLEKNKTFFIKVLKNGNLYFKDGSKVDTFYKLEH
jgi:hypothetical protein